MIETHITFEEDSLTELENRFEAWIERALARSSFRIMMDARDSIEITRRRSKPGNPPHSKRGALPASIAFALDAPNHSAFVGPRYSKINLIGATHEHGGMFRGRIYPPRPFMRPALERNTGFFAASFARS